MKVRSISAILMLSCVAILSSCSTSTTPTVVAPPNFLVTVMAANKATYLPVNIDTNLQDAWGMAVGPTGGFWISDRASGKTSIYDSLGTFKKAYAVNGPGGVKGMPTGQVYNSNSTAFTVGASGPSLFILSTLNGTLSAYPQYGVAGDSLPIVADRSSSSSFTGLALATGSTGTHLFAPDIKNETLDVFDQNFNATSLIVGRYATVGYTPFNAQLIDSQIFVTDAKKVNNFVSVGVAGAGGFVDIYDLNGNFEKSLDSGGTLNSPWGIAIAPANFGSYSGKLLVGNFGDGKINVFDRATGASLGTLSNSNGPIIIPGLWALTVYNGTLYFTSGPNGGADGEFGKITVQ